MKKIKLTKYPNLVGEILENGRLKVSFHNLVKNHEEFCLNISENEKIISNQNKNLGEREGKYFIFYIESTKKILKNYEKHTSATSKIKK